MTAAQKIQSDAPPFAADMVITISLARDPSGDIQVRRATEVHSEPLKAVHDAMTEADHEVVRRLLAFYVEPFVGLFEILGDMKLLRDALGERMS